MSGMPPSVHLWQTKGLQTAILEVWQAKDLRADLVDLWQTRDLAAFLKKAEVCFRRMRKTTWRGDISEPGTDPWRLPLAPFEACGRQAQGNRGKQGE
jgi:hypothetical protein